jgi:hypothetical protein
MCSLKLLLIYSFINTCHKHIEKQNPPVGGPTLVAAPANGQEPKANSQDLKVTIAVGITSSHSEQSS